MSDPAPARGGAMLTRRRAHRLSAAPILVILLMLGPVAAGLLGVAAPAFGWLPALGGVRLTLAPWAALFQEPGIWRSILLSLGPGLISTAIALAAVLLFLAGVSGSRLYRVMLGAVSPLLAVPHAAAALGLMFLIAPSGWLARLFSPWATGWERPPDLLIIHDPLALSMIAALVIKEIPFLLLIAIAALPQLDAPRRVRAARSLGCGPAQAWLRTVAPDLYPLMRLPVYAVIAYAASTVEIALILGPTLPSPLAVAILGWMNDPDLSQRFMASAGALVQLGVILVAIGVWRLGEIAVWRAFRPIAARGMGGGPAGERLMSALGGALVGGAALALGLGLLGLLVSSVSGFWRFPDALPGSVTLRHWAGAADALGGRLWTTSVIAIVAASVSLALVVLVLEAERRATGGLRPNRALAVVYAPLIAPQVSFLFGLTIAAERLGLTPGVALVTAAHVVFVLPYVYLSLAGVYRRLDPRWERVARSLGAGDAQTFWRVRAPLLLKPALTALAVGLAVSIGQYLPTQLLGAGRVATVTTEAVALAAGGDRRVIGVWAIAQAVLPAIGFWLALAVPALLWRRRRGMRETE